MKVEEWIWVGKSQGKERLKQIMQHLHGLHIVWKHGTSVKQCKLLGDSGYVILSLILKNSEIPVKESEFLQFSNA